MLFSVRGAIYSMPFLIGGLVISNGFFLPSEPTTGLLAPIAETVVGYINLLGFGLSLVGFVVWIATWLDDYQSDYLSKWLINQI